MLNRFQKSGSTARAVGCRLKLINYEKRNKNQNYTFSPMVIRLCIVCLYLLGPVQNHH